MRASSLPVFIFVCAMETAGTLAAPHAISMGQTVVLDGVSAAVEVGPANDYPRDGYYVTAVFHAENGTPVQVFCLSVIQDFRYELRNSSGAIVPIDWRVFADTDLQPGWSEPPEMTPCATVEHRGGRSIKFMPLAAFYPHVPPGIYTLRLTFAPRGLLEQAALPPITITVDKDHPL